MAFGFAASAASSLTGLRLRGLDDLEHVQAGAWVVDSEEIRGTSFGEVLFKGINCYGSFINFKSTATDDDDDEPILAFTKRWNYLVNKRR